ncbi:uncharacterized protein LOC122647190 [Telopea speciosissima]|uniref:uncharacterized protein LOC122647190 n=1 Tax=Telopea speciosissima TaxID=54955 RepID=UPI001CC7F1CD|nr:uncharacterized protein LOC122647190 [Telopea speciosissima]
MYGALATDDKVRRRAVALASRCELCGVACESGTHIFLNCNYSSDVLREILLYFNESLNGFPTIQLLFSWWLTPLPKIWGPLKVIICQQIWLERNRRRYDNIKRSHSQVVKMCFREVRDCTKTEGVMIKSVHDLTLARMLRTPTARSPAKPILEVKWKHPPSGWLKLNIDGSSFGNPGSVGAGGIFRNRNLALQLNALLLSRRLELISWPRWQRSWWVLKKLASFTSPSSG